MVFRFSYSKPIFSLGCLWAIALLLFSPRSGHADPWGKDAELARSCKVSGAQPSLHAPRGRLTRWGIGAIRFHQNVISPADGPRSHYIPSSSQYTLEAMERWGFFKGFLMGCDRLMRENDEEWVYRKTYDGAGHPMKWDPIEGK